MKRHTFIKTAVTLLAMGRLGITSAQTPIAAQDRIRGYELMSDQERNAHLERLRLAQTEQERERIRQEHRDKMELRMRAIKNTQGRGADAGAGAGTATGPASGMQKSPIILRKHNRARP